MKKLFIVLLCVLSGLVGAWIYSYRESFEIFEAMCTQNEAALFQLHTSACDAYWNKKDELAEFALKQYIEFGKFVGRVRLASVDDEAGEWFVANLRLAAVEKELNRVEAAEQYTKTAQSIAAGSAKFKTWTPEAMQTLTQRLDSKHTP